MRALPGITTAQYRANLRRADGSGTQTRVSVARRVPPGTGTTVKLMTDFA